MSGRAGRSGGGNVKRPEEKLGKPTKAAAAMPGFDRIDASDQPAPVIPEPEEYWHRAAKVVWDAVLNSPTKIYAESTDYASLYLLCEAVHAMAIGGYKAMALSAVHAMMRDLGMTEIQRRQAKILIDRREPEVELAPVSQIDDARKHFGT